MRPGLHEGTVVDLGCGSGILARIVSEAGFDVRGVDISEDMIALARANAPRATFAQGSLLDAELPHAVAVTAIGEALNYATDPRAGLAEVERLAGRVHAALDPAGVFLFDVATPGRHGVDVVRKFHEREDWSMFVRLEEHDGTLDRRMTTFRATGEDGLYRRTDEHHVLRLYDPAALTAALERRRLRRRGQGRLRRGLRLDAALRLDRGRGAPDPALTLWHSDGYPVSTRRVLEC